MTLTKQDYRNLARKIALGHGTIEYNKNGETLLVCYAYNEAGYTEDDYRNGTGAYIVTAIFLSADAESYDEDGDTANDFNERELERELESGIRF